MRFLRENLDRIAPHFEAGGRFERLYPLYEAADSFLYTPGIVTRTGSHVRDGLDYKRMMSLVVVALLPCFAMAMYNTGLQASLAIQAGATPLEDWQNALFATIGGSYDPSSALWCALLGALYFLPVYAVTMAAGGTVEMIFSIVRKHEVNEGFLVSGALIPLTLPPTIPLWQVALGTAAGIVLAKEVFGGTGMNFLNPALVCRAILFFAYPADISGDAPWIAADFVNVDGFTGATWLAQAAATPGALAAASWCRLPDPDPRRILALHGRGHRRHRRDGVPPQLRRLGYEPDVRRALPLAHRAGGLGAGHRLHGDRPGELQLHRQRALGLRDRDRRAVRADPLREPCVPRRHDAGDPVHEHVRAADRLLRDPPQRGAEARPQWSIVRVTR
jgi:Na+-transporting NADH:ubiquinone oxidoreductase subunit B